MSRYKISITFAIIGIIFISIFMIVSTYAYFRVYVTGEPNDIIINTLPEAEVIYTDTSNVTMLNAYTGDSITKTFTVKNNSDYVVYYDISFKNVVNDFANPDDLVYEISSTNNGAVRNQTVVPQTDTMIASKIKLPANVTQSYQLKITFLETGENQNNNMNKTFSSVIGVTATVGVNVSEDMYKSGTLAATIVNNATGPFTGDLGSDPVNGIYYTNSSINGATVYFYRGSNTLNNNLVVGNKCYKIIRLTEDDGVRAIYSGTFSSNTCNTTMSMSSRSYNSIANYNAYVGYMYGTASSSSYVNEHANTNSSSVKSALESWYNSNLSSYSNLIATNAIYCNDRKPNNFTLNNVLYGKLGYGNNNTGYVYYGKRPGTYDCVNVNDRLSVSNSNGSSVLTAPVGLITYDELLYAGYRFGNASGNSTNFLNATTKFWTMTPAYYDGSTAYAYVAGNGTLEPLAVSSSYNARPVITLKGNDLVTSGNGSTANPYRIGAPS